MKVANSQLEKPSSTTTLKFENRDKIFAEHFVVIKKLTRPIIGLQFMRNNEVVTDTTHGLIYFPHLTLQVKTASSETTAKSQPVITDDALTIAPRTTKTITAFVDHPSEWNTTGTKMPLENLMGKASLLTSHSMSTLIDKRFTVRVTNVTESPYLFKRHTQIAEFSVVTPEQSKYIKPVDWAILSLIPQGDPDLPAYLNELLRTNKLEQQKTLSGSRHLKILQNREGHIPIQTGVLKKLFELKEKEKVNPQKTVESRTKILKRFDWTNTLLTETEKQAIEDILVVNHDNFARHRMATGMDTEFKMKLIRKDDKFLQPKSIDASPLQRKLKRRISSDAQIRNHNGTAFLQVRKSHICTEEAQQDTTSSCGSLENQQSDCKWIFQKQSSS